jgi:para-nitrobenzyl esterase
MGTVATTRAGTLEGETVRGIELFRGVPYARPPVGKLRFRPPEPVEPWSGVRRAVRTGPTSPQLSPVLPLLERLIGGGGAGHSEDCLYLNVWTPAVDGRRRPVLVWIHGGAFVMGSGSTRLYSGRRMAMRGDVVVVTLNYRLGALGFLNLRGLIPGSDDAPSNAGLRDQIAAPEWVRDNIEAFGGDPENVTIFGESAGAMSVATLLGTPRAQGLFHRAVMQSGAAHNVLTKEQSAGIAELLLRELGLDALDTAALEGIRVPRLLRAQRDVALKGGMQLGLLPWAPSVDDDLLPGQPLDAVARGCSSSVPILIGTNRDEWKLFMLGDRRGRQLDEDGLRKRLELTLPGREPDGTPHAELALETYRRTRTGRGRASPTALWIAIQSDRVFRYPATRLAELHAAHTPSTYSYLFTWAPPLARNQLGAAHGLEIPFVFGTLREPLLRPVFGMTEGARELGRRMQDAWVQFARSGHPGHQDLPEWPAYESKRRSTMILGLRCYAEDSPLDAERGFWEGRLLP